MSITYPMKKDENGGPLIIESSSDSSPSRSSLYDLADLMAHLPIKGRPRMGLSKHYNGKSESFACVTSVRSVEDLAKKERIKYCCKSLAPKPAIAKRSAKGSLRLQCFLV